MSPAQQLRMNCLYVHSTELGYGRMGVKLVEALERMGVEIFDDLPAPTSSRAMSFIPHVSGKSAVSAATSRGSPPRATVAATGRDRRARS